MNFAEVARRTAQLANILLSLSLLTVLLSFEWSVALFIGGWVVFGLARLVEAMGPLPSSDAAGPEPAALSALQ